jgi:hypothetical protein
MKKYARMVCAATLVLMAVNIDSIAGCIEIPVADLSLAERSGKSQSRDSQLKYFDSAEQVAAVAAGVPRPTLTIHVSPDVATGAIVSHQPAVPASPVSIGSPISSTISLVTLSSPTSLPPTSATSVSSRPAATAAASQPPLPSLPAAARQEAGRWAVTIPRLPLEDFNQRARNPEDALSDRPSIHAMVADGAAKARRADMVAVCKMKDDGQPRPIACLKSDIRKSTHFDLLHKNDCSHKKVVNALDASQRQVLPSTKDQAKADTRHYNLPAISDYFMYCKESETVVQLTNLDAYNRPAFWRVRRKYEPVSWQKADDILRIFRSSFGEEIHATLCAGQRVSESSLMRP